MTIGEASKAFDISVNLLNKYISEGFLPKRRNGDYSETDFQQLGTVIMLMNAGSTAEEAKKYINLSKEEGTQEAQIKILRKLRRELLDHIHDKQQLLDKVDYMIWQIKKEKNS